ncbi:MAG: glucose-6-phosphate isomerase [Chloroflexota bacterium]|nr:MAG: glucose-6-phosphate isomerase [Chloroflexota bacterium]
MTKLHELAHLGQSIWLDFIRRSFITSGELQTLIDQGATGITSNPAIFEKAIAHSSDYDRQLQELVAAGKSTEEIYERLTMQDIAAAADLFRPVYDQSGGTDGFVSLEVSPTLANNTLATLADARRLFAALGRPNVMIKVPATAEGIPAIRQLISEGININITLMFSMAHYEAVAEAYLAGLEKLAASGGDVSKVNSVASFFVSRVDSLLDPRLEAAGAPELVGTAAIANTKLVYQRFKAIFSGPRWQRLADQGARVQRPLWASTSTKNPDFPDTLYVDTLIGPHTINTLPPATLDAFLDHGVVAVTIEDDLDEAQRQLARLAELGIDLNAAGEELLQDGVDKFVQAFEALLRAIDQKSADVRAGWQNISAALWDQRAAVDAALRRMEHDQVIARIWDGDHTVWRPDPTEISNRLGWLRTPQDMLAELEHSGAAPAHAWSTAGSINELVDAVRGDGYTQALVLGMGGSSLAPDVFSRTFGAAEGYLSLAVLDSTDPAAVAAHERALDLSKTLFVVSTKSGGTVETMSLFKYFYNQVSAAVGAEHAGAHFIAITDAGSSLEKLASEYGFRHVFLNDPNIGGRYSALSHFGLVPAALAGVDIRLLLERAATMARGCARDLPGNDNPAAWLGAIMAVQAQAGADKATFIASPAVASFGDWAEQLIAESTGKDGTGIVPVVAEPLGAPAVYGDDRLFFYLHLDGDDTYEQQVALLEQARRPVVRIRLCDRYDLGAQFFLWELAVAVAGHLLNIQPFDQPNVESAKVLGRQMVAAFSEAGTFPPEAPLLTENGVAVSGGAPARSLGEALALFLNQAHPASYVGLQAYIAPTPETDTLLEAIRARLRDKYRLATTVGYGPRYLHSTGQLHKGDGGSGLFLQITSDAAADLPIPDAAGAPQSSLTFGTLKLAQALGDREALLENGRRVLRLHLGTDVQGGLRALLAAL